MKCRAPGFISSARRFCRCATKTSFLRLDSGAISSLKGGIVECKAVKELAAIDTAQVLNYLKLADLEFGLLINFNRSPITEGLKRILNETVSGVKTEEG